MVCKILLWIVLVVYGFTLIILTTNDIGSISDLISTARVTLFFGALAWLIYYSFKRRC